MRITCIHDTRDFYVASLGNGLAYSVVNKNTKASLLFQGDDARSFEDALESLTEGRVQLDYNNALHVIWNDYTALTVEVYA